MKGPVTLWNAHLLQYLVGNRDVFFCPAFPESFRWDDEPSRAGCHFPTNIQGGKPFSYAINADGRDIVASVPVVGLGLHHGGLPYGPGAYGRRPSEIVVPSDMVAIGGGPGPRAPGKLPPSGYGVFNFFGLNPEEPPSAGGPPVAFGNYETGVANRHGQGGNMVFLDGHVEWQHWWKWIEFSDAAARRWNYDNQPHKEFWVQYQ